MEFKIPVPWGYIAGKSYGNWSGTPVLGIHSWLDNSASFDLLAPLLPKEIFFVVIDLPGHGQSSHYPPGIAYHRVDFATVIKRVADHQRWKKFTLLGHGVGAEFAVLFAAAFSNMVIRLILIDAIKPTSFSFINGAKILAAVVNEQLDSDVKYQLITENPPVFELQAEIQLQVERSKGELSETQAKIIVDRHTLNAGEQLKFSLDPRLTCSDTLRLSDDQAMNLLEKVKGLKVLFIKTKDTPLPEDEGLTKLALEKYRRICLHFKEIEIPGGHYGHITGPENFVDVIGDFLDD